MAVTKSRLHVRKGDMVLVLSGKDKGKRGRIIQALPREQKVTVEGVNVVKRHMKPRQQRVTQAGIIEKPAPIVVSKVMLVCPKCSNPTKIVRKVVEDGKRARFCRRCGEMIDSL